MSLFQEKISSFFNPTPSLKMKPLPNKSIPDLNSLQKYPKLFLHFVGNKHDSHYFVQHLKNIDLYEERKKSSYTKNVLKGLEKIPIHDLIDKYSKQNSICLTLRKILKIKLKQYETIGTNKRIFWLVASDAKYLMDQNPNYYKTLKESLTKYANHSHNIIEMDLKRTLPINPNEEHVNILNRCRQILNTYARRNPDLGYCQGLNFIAWEICKIYFSEEEGFWFFTALIENILPLDYYLSLEGVLVDQKIFNSLIEINLPQIAKKLNDCNLDCSAFSIPWFVCIYSRTLNYKLFEVVLDNLIIQGSLALFKIGLSLLKLLEDQILKAEDFPHLLKIIEEKSKYFNDPIKFQELINEIYLCKKIIKLARLYFGNIVQEEELQDIIKHNKFSKKNIKHNYERLKESKSKCDVNDFTCLTSIELNKISRRSFGYFTFKQNPKLLNVIQNYIPEANNSKHTKNGEILKGICSSYMKNNSNNNNNHDVITTMDKILIGRHEHICKTFDNGLQKKKFKDDDDDDDEEDLPLENNDTLKNFITQSVKDSREIVQERSIRERKIRAQANNSFDFKKKGRNSSMRMSASQYEFLDKLKNGKTFPLENSLYYEGRFSEYEFFLDNKNPYKILPKKSLEYEHSVILLDDNLSSNKNKTKEDEEIDQEHHLKPRESIIILKNKRVFSNISTEIMEKYMSDIEESESYEFVNLFLSKNL